LLELTYSADGTTCDCDTAESIRALATHFDGRMLIGAGTVLTERQVELTKQAGGSFIISPNVNPRVIERTRQCGLVSIPGAFTPSEIVTAHEAGADFVKIFPASSLGADYIKAVKAPLSHVELLAVGGVTLDSIPSYNAAGVCGFGIASHITDKALLEKEDWQGLSALAASYCRAIKGN